MKNRLLKTVVTLSIACLGLSACDQTKFRSAEPTPDSNPVQGAQAEDKSAQDYTKTVDLNFSHTRDDLAQRKNNAVTLRGRGSKSTYKVKYKFNSGESRAFKLMSLYRGSESAGCDLPDAKAVLKHQGKSEDVSPINKIGIEPHTDYVLEITNEQSCAKLDLTYDVVAWMDSDITFEPALARTCLNTDGSAMSFFRINSLTGFIGNKAFVGGDMHFCGEDVSLIMDCKGASTGFKGTLPQSYSCEGGAAEQKRSFALKFDPALRTAELNCKKKDAQVYHASLHDCHETILPMPTTY